MRKIFYIFLAYLLLSLVSCGTSYDDRVEITPDNAADSVEIKKERSDTKTYPIEFEDSERITVTSVVIDDIEYHVYARHNDYDYVGGIFVINHTKEQLEVDYFDKESHKR